MATDAQRLQTIAHNIEILYQQMRRAAAAIAGLLQLGRATCKEVRAYNLWALACYNTQRGMLATLRANGEPNIPELPPYPTMFTWKGFSGENAWNIDCDSAENNLSGVLRDAMSDKKPQYLSTEQIAIVTQDQHVFDPEASPSFKQLLERQVDAAKAENNLGAATIFIVIAAITIGVSVAVAAIMKYLETSAVQEANSEQVALQAKAYADYTGAKLDCLKTCTGQGQSTEQCVDTCRGLVKEPEINLPGAEKPWGWLQWTGFTVVAGVGATVAYRIWQRKAAGKPVFEFPELP